MKTLVVGGAVGRWVAVGEAVVGAEVVGDVVGAVDGLRVGSWLNDGGAVEGFRVGSWLNDGDAVGGDDGATVGRAL